MFITDKNLVKFLTKENERLHSEINELYNKQIEDIKVDSDGRLKLAKMCNELSVLSNEDIRKIVADYLGI